MHCARCLARSPCATPCWRCVRGIVGQGGTCGREQRQWRTIWGVPVRMRWGEQIPMRDGIRLNATLYLPKQMLAPAPAIVTMTPYIAQTYHDRGLYFAERGLPFLIVDVRGRGNSEGEFRPNIQEAHDGHDVIEWLARQSFCNG